MPAAIVGTPKGHAITPFATVPTGVPALVAPEVTEDPVKTCAAAVRLFTVSAGTVVLAPVKT